MKQLFRFKRFGSGWPVTSPAAAKDALNNSAAPSQARPVFQLLSASTTSSILESGTSRGGPQGQAGLGDLACLILSFCSHTPVSP